MWRCLKVGFGLLAVLLVTNSLVFAEPDGLKNTTFGLGNLKPIDSELKVASGQVVMDINKKPNLQTCSS